MSADTLSSLELQAVPNPATEDVRLQWHGAGLLGTLMVSISDECGSEVERRVIAATEHGTVWNTSGHATGTYFVTVRTADGQSVTRPVVVR